MSATWHLLLKHADLITMHVVLRSTLILTRLETAYATLTKILELMYRNVNMKMEIASSTMICTAQTRMNVALFPLSTEIHSRIASAMEDTLPRPNVNLMGQIATTLGIRI